MATHQPNSLTADLLTLVEQDCGPGRRSGRWWMFHCPFPEHAHGDRNPSLAITPDNGRWHCFTCGRSGDAIGWLIQSRGMVFREAIELLGLSKISKPRHYHKEKALDAESMTQSIWQKRGLEFISFAEANLWSSEGQRALEYLQNRGLTESTIKKYHLGLNIDDQHEPVIAWGLPSNRGNVWLPRGITVPYLIRNILWGINIRRPVGKPKYVKISGSRSALFGAENLLGADVGLLCEGEFDCMIADQYVGDAIGVATLGSASKKLNLATWGPYLMRLQLILVAYDTDHAGNQGAEYLISLGDKIRQITLPSGPWKDINEFTLGGGDMWEWIKPSIDLPFLSEEKSLVEILIELGGVVTAESNEKGENV